MQILESKTIYRDEEYVAFPNLARLADGTVICAFRHAKNRLAEYGKFTHIDPTAKDVFISSPDGGLSFDKTLHLIVDDEMSDQDPCVNVLSDGRIIVTYFRWALVPMGEGPAHWGAQPFHDFGREEVLNRYSSFPDGASYSISDDNGKTFRCTVKNSCGTATRDFTLNVPAQDEDMPPAYTHPSQEKEVPFKAGETVVLTMPSEDGESVRFAWYAIGGDGDPVLLDGEDGDTFTISNCASEYDGATLVCVASDEAGNTESLAFKLVMIPEGEPPVITSPTSDTSILVCEGESVTLSITAENADGYQWYVDKDGDGLMEEIEGATDPSYTILSVKNEMSDYAYACVAYNEFGYAGSPVFVFQVDGVPKMPATGDNSMPFVWLSMMLASAAACVYMLRSRRAE